MAKKFDLKSMNNCKPCGPGSSDAVYGLGFLGALVYYITTAPDLVAILVGIVKAILWPAILVYGLLKQFGL